MVFMTTWLNLKTSCQLKKSEAKGYITLHLQKGRKQADLSLFSGFHSRACLPLLLGLVCPEQEG